MNLAYCQVIPTTNLDCGGKAERRHRFSGRVFPTECHLSSESAVAAALCRRTPKSFYQAWNISKHPASTSIFLSRRGIAKAVVPQNKKIARSKPNSKTNRPKTNPISLSNCPRWQSPANFNNLRNAAFCRKPLRRHFRGPRLG